MWVVSFYNKNARDEVASFPKGVLAKYAHLTTLMETYGPDIGMPYTKHMKRGLIEMRLKAQEGIARVFYAMAMKNEIVILHSIIKKTDKTPKRALELAYKRLSEMRHGKTD